ncbi:MAG: DMP19 family protein [Planctomycetaceae bacterium]|nr:DMP19 family protein [Planctomycetaceae bacterium]
MTSPRIIKKCDVEKEPYLVWNMFIDIVACCCMTEMNEIQKKAALCFWYDSELQNGGHLQYFENMTMRDTTDYQEVAEALNWLGAKSQSEILLKAVAIRKTEKRGIIKNAFDYVVRAKEGKYDALDTEYYNCEPNMNLLFQDLIEKYQNEFVIIEE